MSKTGVVGIRNVCSTFLRIGFGDSCEVVNFLEYYHRMGRTLGGIYCKYRNKKLYFRKKMSYILAL